jgi:hypothetical protein
MNSFIIAGEQRSGTTLLSEVLGRHSQVYIDGYSVGFRLVSCFKHYTRVLPYNAAESQSAIQSWLIENDYKGRLAEFIDYKNLERFPSAQAAIQDGIDNRLSTEAKKVFGDKSPGIHHFMPELLTLVPKARFIHVVRDGRAVAHSQYKRTGKHVELAAQDWVDGNAKGLTNLAWLGADKYLMLKYEDLLSEPENTLKAVCKFLNLEYEPAMTAGKKADGQPDDYVLPSFEVAKIDEYKSGLKARQLRRIEKIEAPLLRRFGYELINELPAGSHRQLSIFRRIWLNQLDNFKRLFVSRRKGMHNRKNVDLQIPLKVRLRNFAFEWGRDFLPEKVFRRVFRKRWIKDVYMKKGAGKY